MDSSLDVLIYAHDGRGLGHVSRSVGIGLALRRIFPDLSVLLITGCASTAELIGEGSLDWIKLPSYKTSVVCGKSSGVKGNSNIDDKLLGELRARNIRDIVAAYNPRVFLADHTPQGKHKELLPALDVSPATRRVLGIRAVVGEVDKVWSELAQGVFKANYSDILWYGDTSVGGAEEFARLEYHYGVRPYEAGYVSRLAELREFQGSEPEVEKLAGVVSIPWSGEGTAVLLDKLAQTLSGIGAKHGNWHIYMDLREPGVMAAISCFSKLENVSFMQVGPQFLRDLGNSRSAVIYGGYNSLTDVMVCGVPSVVLLRGMKDNEQEKHGAVLAGKSSVIRGVFSDHDVSVVQLRASICACLESSAEVVSVNLNGAAHAARYLAALTGVCDVDCES
ncbi:hypothetical protein [Maridesulfovibrio sp.]|uniref:hypothetical protein n=1 Tax=Maridesulfovibrio sp. TaxID=2795000 RepID=UPI0039EE79C3